MQFKYGAANSAEVAASEVDMLCFELSCDVQSTCTFVCKVVSMCFELPLFRKVLVTLHRGLSSGTPLGFVGGLH